MDLGGLFALWATGTSLTVILALLPAALGLGAGADTSRPMAIALIGGIAS
jgi:HAE1 family hydrophobic/amphiphilic exporter-1